MKLELLYKIVPNNLNDWNNMASYHLQIIKDELLVPDFVDLEWLKKDDKSVLLKTSEGCHFNINCNGKLGIYL